LLSNSWKKTNKKCVIFDLEKLSSEKKTQKSMMEQLVI